MTRLKPYALPIVAIGLGFSTRYYARNEQPPTPKEKIEAPEFTVSLRAMGTWMIVGGLVWAGSIAIKK